MMIPYLDRVGVGLCLSREAASLVVWRRRFRQVHLRLDALNPLGDDPVRVLRALREASPHPFVHVAAPDALLACEVVSVPDFDEPEDRDAWAASEAERRRPHGRSHEDVVATAHVFEVPDQPEPTAGLSLSSYRVAPGGGGYTEDVTRHRAVLCVVDRAMIEGMLSLLDEAGFIVERVGSGLVEAASLALIPTSQSDDYTAWDLEPAIAHTFPRVERPNPRTLLVSGAFGSAELDVVAGQPQTVTLRTPPVERSEAYTTVLDGFLQTPQNELGASSQDAPRRLVYPKASRPSSSIAAALAYEALYPGLVLVQVLPETMQQDVRRIRTVEEGKRSTLFMAFGVLALLLVLMGAEILVGALASRTAAQLQEQAPRLALLERDRAEIDQLQRDIRLAKRAQAERTSMAFYLEALTRAAPQGVTLTEVILQPADGVESSLPHAITGEGDRLPRGLSGFSLDKNRGLHNVVSYRITGNAMAGLDVSEYSRGIGKLDFVVETRVLSVTQQTARALRRQQQSSDRLLFAFELTGQIAPRDQ